MIDTLKLSKRLQEANLPKEQAEALAEGLNESLKESYVTREHLDARLNRLELRLVGWIIGTNIAVGSAIVWWINSRFDQLTFFLQHWKPGS